MKIRSVLLLILCLGLLLSARAQAQCTYTLSTNSWIASNAGDSFVVDITTGDYCGWSVTVPNQGPGVFIITRLPVSVSTTQGVGNASVTLVVPANPFCIQRTQTVSIAGIPFPITQDGGTPTYSLATKLWTARGNGDATNVTLYANSGCPWSVVNTADWLTVSPTNGQGERPFNGSRIALSAARNTNDSPRFTILKVANQDLAIYQPVQNPEPGRVALLSPEDDVSLSRHHISLAWTNAEPGAPPAVWYRLTISNLDSNCVDVWLQTNSWQATNSFPYGSYQWQIQPWNWNGYGPASPLWEFTANNNPPSAPKRMAPHSQTNIFPKVCYSWASDSAATWYELCVVKNKAIYTNTWVSVSAFTGTNCEHTLAGHGSGQYSWWVRGWNPDGFGPWSTNANFTVALSRPGTVTLYGPTNIVLPMTLANFCWSEDASTDWYCLWINRNGNKYLSQWVHATNSWIPTNSLPAGNYTWWIQAWNSEGLGPWSAASSFSIPAAGTPYWPIGTLDYSQLGWPAGSEVGYTIWRDETSTWYELYINKDNALFFHQWLPIESMIQEHEGVVITCQPSGHTYGSYTWWVRAWSPTTGMGPWSEPTSFQLVP